MDPLDPAIPAVPEGCTALPVAGACLLPLAVIDAAGGPVMHMLRPSAPLRPDNDAGAPLLALGEVYFSEVLPGAVKAWKRHRRQTQHFAVPSGRLLVVLHDARPSSPTRGATRPVTLGRPDGYALLRIPPGVWYGFAALDDAPALICNAADIPHDPAEGEKLPADSPEIPWRWDGLPPAGA